jgi:predicted ATPase
MQRLLSSGLVQAAGGDAEGGDFRFKHALIWDAAYGIIVRPRRRALHATIAQALEAHFPHIAAAQPQLVAHHYAAAEITDGAARWWLRAGAQAMQRSSPAEALLQLHQALAMVETLPDSPERRRLELDVLVLLGKATIATSGHAAAATGAILARARALCDAAHSPAALMATLFGQAMHHLLRGDMAPAQRLTRALLQLGEARGDPAWIATGCYARGLAGFSLGAFARAAELLQRGLDLLAEQGAAPLDIPTVGHPPVVMRAILSWALFCRGEVAAAEAASTRALAEARRLGQGYSLAFALNNHCYIATMVHAPLVALPAVEEMLAVAQAHGLTYFAALATVMRGWCLGLAGDLPGGLAVLHAGLAAYRATGSRLSLAAVLRLAAELEWRAGDVAAALLRTGEALALGAASAERWGEAEVRRMQGALLAARGEAAAAEASLRGAMALAAAQGARLWQLRASLSLATLLQDQRREPEGAAILAAACAAFPAAAGFADLTAARRMLDATGATT